MDYLNRLRAAVTEKDEIEKVLVGGFSTLVAAASPGMPSRHDPRYYTAPLGSPSVYATPAAPNFTRRQRHGAHTKESIVESSLRNLHNTAMDELEASSSRQTSSVRSSSCSSMSLSLSTHLYKTMWSVKSVHLHFTVVVHVHFTLKLEESASPPPASYNARTGI